MMMMVQLQPFFFEACKRTSGSKIVRAQKEVESAEKKMMMMLVLGDGYLPGLRKFCLLVFV